MADATRRARTSTAEVDASRSPQDIGPLLLPPTDDPKVLADRARQIRAGWCPACGCGPFQVVLNHAARKHGILRHNMRDLCGLTYSESVCDPEVSAAARKRWMARKEMDPGRQGASKRSAGTMSLEARRRAGQRVSKWAAENPEAARRVQSSNGKRNAAARWADLPPHYCADCGADAPRTQVRCDSCRAKKRLEQEGRWALVLRLRAAGKTDREIAAVLGVSRRTASKIRQAAERNAHC